jgi:prepilin-type processing-associated H-X9-DG protein
LDEPWDSDHDKKLIPLIPSVYRNPNRPNNDFKTTYLAVSGKGTMFDGREGISASSVVLRDGLTNTLLLVEANEDRAVIWTKPDDLEVNEKDPQAGLGKVRPGGFSAAFADGHV